MNEVSEATKGARPAASRGAVSVVAGKRKAEAVLRVMEGEAAHEVAAALGVRVTDVEAWRREFVIAGERRMGELPLGLLERCLSPFERLVPLGTLISVGIAVLVFVQAQSHDRQAREKETTRERDQRVTESFNALDDKYIEYVKLCLQHPDLDVFDTPLPRPAAAAAMTPEVRRRESMMFAILLSVLERSYLMYRDQTDPFKREQWAGWDEYIRSWLTRENFVGEYERTKREYDAAFMAYVDGLLAERRRSAPATTQASGSAGAVPVR